jgi:hypothetical protein
MAYGLRSPGRSRVSHFSDGRAIAPAAAYFEHKSCAVKLHAYTLDKSAILCKCSAARIGFPTDMAIPLALQARHGKGCAP